MTWFLASLGLGWWAVYCGWRLMERRRERLSLRSELRRRLTVLSVEGRPVLRLVRR